MAMTPSLVFAKVMHARQRPKKHAFNYRVSYLYFALSDIPKLAMRFLSVNRWNLLSFYEKDYGPRDGTSLDAWIRGILNQHGITEADGEVRLLTLPRHFGYVFNPVSFWFCFDRNEKLHAVLSEVSNTFGEHHSYLSYHSDHRPIEPADELHSEKVFHVSPFMDIEGHYRFHFAFNPNGLGVTINYYDRTGLMLATGIKGAYESLNPARLLKGLMRSPLVTFKVIGLIHVEAVRLLLKGIQYRPKPPPPTPEVTT